MGKLIFLSNFALLPSSQVKFERVKMGSEVKNHITYQSKDGLWGSGAKTGKILSGVW